MNNFWTAAKELSPRLFHMYAVIDKLNTNDVKYCYSTNEGISERIEKHKNNVSKDISELIKLGYLYSLEKKVGFKVIQRRLYTENNYKQYLEDKENIENWLPTYSVTKDGITYYWNEKNPHPKWHKNIEKTTDNENVNGTDNENVNGTDNENVKYNLYNNNLNNKTEITEEPVSVSEKILSKTEKVKFVLNTEKVHLDFKFINELVNKYDFETIVKLIKLIPKDAENQGAYLRGIIKNTKPKTYNQKQKEAIKKEVVEVPKVEEPKEKEPRDIIIAKFCIESNCQIENIPTFLKNILNKTLEGLNYEQIS